MIIKNIEEFNLNSSDLIPNYQYRQPNENSFFFSHRIPSTNKIVLRRIKLSDKNMIFAIPLFIADKPFYISVFDMKTKYLYYHPKNPEGSVDFNAPLSCTLLKFNFDWLTEY